MNLLALGLAVCCKTEVKFKGHFTSNKFMIECRKDTESFDNDALHLAWDSVVKKIMSL